MTDIIIIIVLIVILGGAISMMNKERVKNVSCIGCPDAPVCEMRRKGLSCPGKESHM